MLNNNSKISGDFNVNKKVDIWQAGPSTEHYPQFLTFTLTLTWPGSWHGMTTTRAASSSSHPIIFPNIFLPSRHFWGYLTPRARMMTEREVSEECRVRPDKFRGPGHYTGQTRRSILGSVCPTKIGQRAKRDLWKIWERPVWDLRETWARMMRIDCSGQTWNEHTNLSISWAPDGAKKNLYDNWDKYRRQLERDNERHAEGGVWWHRGLPAELLRKSIRRSHVFRRVRPHGPIRPCQRRGCRPDEASRGVPQTGKMYCPRLFTRHAADNINNSEIFEWGEFVLGEARWSLSSTML